MDAMATTRPPRVLIVSASVGAGHDGAAVQLAGALSALGFEVSRADFLDLLPGRTGAWLSRMYATQLRVFPGSWGVLLRVLHHRRMTLWASAAAAGAARRRTHAALTGTEAAVISTYPLASQALGSLRAAGRLPAPVVTFLCDLSVHPLWVADGVDAHVAVDPVAAQQATRLGAAGVSVCAPLVDSAFRPAAPGERADARRRFGLPDGPLALVVGGAWGVGQMEQTSRDIATSGVATPVTVCARNEALRQRLTATGYGIPLGWVDDMPTLMRAADIVVHNAGGLTCLEAAASGVPVITYRALPGHGTTNAAALLDAGLAPWPRHRDDLAAALRHALDEPEERRLCTIGALHQRPAVVDVIHAMINAGHPSLAGSTPPASLATLAGAPL